MNAEEFAKANPNANVLVHRHQGDFYGRVIGWWENNNMDHILVSSDQVSSLFIDYPEVSAHQERFVSVPFWNIDKTYRLARLDEVTLMAGTTSQFLPAPIHSAQNAVITLNFATIKFLDKIDFIKFEYNLPKDPDFPHECPKCKGPAYMGFNKVDCKGKCS